MKVGLRDMALSMVVLAVIVLVLAAISRGCSFSPGGPSDTNVSLPPVDVTGELGAAAGQVGFPLRQPALPAGWRPNSASVNAVGPNGHDHDVRIGWLTPSGGYVQLSQSDAAPGDLAAAIAGTGVTATGTVTVGPSTWTTYPGVRAETSWLRDLGPVRLLVTGNGTPAEFRTLAEAAENGERVTATGTG
jgi:Protein of unknown function (DUF4245)